MNQAAPNLGERKSSEELHKIKDAYRQKGAETGKLYWAKNPVGFHKVSLH